MFSKVYKQKFFFIPAKGKKAQALENTRVFRKLAFKGSSRNSAIKDIRRIQGRTKECNGGHYRTGKRHIRHIKAYPRTSPDIQEKKTFNVFKGLCQKDNF